MRRILLALLLLAPAPLAKAQQIAFTWDDLPAHSALPEGQSRIDIANAIVVAMKAAGLPPAYGFVNGIQTIREPLSTPVLTNWHAAGLPLGNHTWSHMNLDQNSVEAFEADLLKDEPLLRSTDPAGNWHWLRFPYLAEGDTPEKEAAIRAFLLARHYKIADVTLSFGDYAWNEPYARCVARHDTDAIAQLSLSYLAAADDDLTFRRAMAHTLFGHDIPYVLLMHVGALDSKLLPQLLALYKSRGASFITLQQAEQDPFYAPDTDLSLPATPDTLEGQLAARHLPFPPHQPMPANLQTLCR